MNFDFLKDADSSTTGWIVAALGGAVLGLAKLRTLLASERKDSTSSDASSSVIEMLRIEISRLADQNTRLASMVNNLQLQVIALRNENMELRDLIQKDVSMKKSSERVGYTRKSDFGALDT